jgi:hypothetical protein
MRLMGMHLIGVYLMGVHLTGMCLMHIWHWHNFTNHLCAKLL